ncbi:MAG TPA: ABC transporter ATP-binding protein [Alphaproteobacteria bacterium]|nr:ABC transporter ATP-binding protein [Alphaproteobacteria bacterium]
MIRVSNVSLSFGGIRAVRDCSLEVERGTITGLIGPNGAGKTTLFNIVAGFLRPAQGRIELAGEDVTGVPPHVLFRRGLVRTFQIPHEFATLTVVENLMLVPSRQSGERLLGAWLRARRVAAEEAALRRRAEETLEFLRLDHLRDAPAGTLSGGQKKLLELGRAMMADAQVVLLDEPAAGVNRTLMNELAERIRFLNQERGVTFFVIEHDMNLIAALCHPVIVMTQGEVLMQGALDEIRRDPRVVEAYLGAAGASA